MISMGSFTLSLIFLIHISFILNALLQYREQIEVILGQFKSGVVGMPLEKPKGRRKYARVIKMEEKGSDVNLAVNMVNDGWKNEYDLAVLCSNDTDLIEPWRGN